MSKKIIGFKHYDGIYQGFPYDSVEFYCTELTSDTSVKTFPADEKSKGSHIQYGGEIGSYLKIRLSDLGLSGSFDDVYDDLLGFCGHIYQPYYDRFGKVVALNRVDV